MGNKTIKYIFLLIILLGTICMAGGFLYKYYFSEYYFPVYPFVPIFFLILGIPSLFVMEKAAHKERKDFYLSFMILKGVKLFSNVLVCILYAFLIKKCVISFIITFAIFYVTYSVFEAFASTKFNKEIHHDSVQK